MFSAAVHTRAYTHANTHSYAQLLSFCTSVCSRKYHPHAHARNVHDPTLALKTRSPSNQHKTKQAEGTVVETVTDVIEIALALLAEAGVVGGKDVTATVTARLGGGIAPATETGTAGIGVMRTLLGGTRNLQMRKRSTIRLRRRLR